ncbi:MAG: IS5 family transposase [Deltaproteobacteria bacterium]|nr:IS5 family transposase [Deltaproteobacteria bacterium]
MYRHNVKQLSFEDFFLPFGGHLRGDNRWIKLSEQIPWELVEDIYVSKLRSDFGAPAHSARMAFGSLLIKERLGLSDEETVAQITENPYLQHFIGLKEFQKEVPFDSSQMVYFRKRFSAEAVDRINEAIAVARVREKLKENDAPRSTDNTPPNDICSSQENEPEQPQEKTKNQGKLLVDATCTPADVAYPTDLNLLNKAREKAEKIIDVLHAARTDGAPKPRTYRKKARKRYLAVARSKRPGRKKVRKAIGQQLRFLRKAIGQQLRFLRRDLGHIDTLTGHVSLTVLPPRQYRDLLVINEVYRQQKAMYESKTHRIDDRIISISQPHIRPIKRGKVVADTEFGAKVSISLVHGYAFTERISWNNFNEGIDLIEIIKKYHKRFDMYPESVHVDKIYRNRENRKYCRKHGIRLSGPPLGRPRKATPENHAELKAARRLTRQDELDRIPVEGKFGQGKRRFSLGRIMAKLADTSATVIALNILVMNLEKLLKTALSSLLFVPWLCFVTPLYEAVQRFSVSLRRHLIIRHRLGLINGVGSIA